MSLPVQVEDVLALSEDELHHLVLVHHVDCHVSSVQLRPHQRRPEHDTKALSGHQVPPGELQHAEKAFKEEDVWSEQENQRYT